VSEVAKCKQAWHNGMFSSIFSTKDLWILGYYLLFPPSRYLSVSCLLQYFASTQFLLQHIFTYHLVVLQTVFPHMHLEDSPVIHTTLTCLIDSRAIIHYYKKLKTV